jgi:hypothetical protein
VYLIFLFGWTEDADDEINRMRRPATYVQTMSVSLCQAKTLRRASHSQR